MSFIQERIPFVTTIRISDLIDIAILSFAIYQLLWIMRKTSSGRVLKGILVLILAMWLASALQLTATSWALNYVVSQGILVLVIPGADGQRKADEYVQQPAAGLAPRHGDRHSGDGRRLYLHVQG